MPEMTEEQFTTEASAFLTANADRKSVVAGKSV